MVGSPDQIISLLVQYQYYILFPLVVVEGPLVTIIAGFLASLGYFNLIALYALVVMADLVGDSLYYVIGRLGREHLIEKWGRFVGITLNSIERVERHFEKHQGKTLIFGKLSHAIGGVILVAAGIARIPYRDFLFFNFLATLPKSLILLFIGFYFGQAFRQISKYLDYTAFLLVLAAVILIAIYFIIQKIAKIISESD